MKGQVAIIVLLVSAVMLTLGLTMSKKENVNVKINTNDELLKKAFDTAESGINYYLGTGGTSYTSPDNVSFADVSTTKIGDGSDRVDFGEYIQQGNSENYWLVSHLLNGDIGTTYFAGPNVSVCTTSFSGQAKVDFFYKVGVNFNVKRSLLTFNSNCQTVSMIGSPILLAVTPISSGGKFYIQAQNGGVFSSQGVDVVAVGRAGGTQAGADTQAKQKLSIRQRYTVPGFLLSGMMAEGSILSD